MKTTLVRRFTIVAWCLLAVGQLIAQDDAPPADANAEARIPPVAPAATSEIVSRTYAISHNLKSAIDRLPDSFRSDPRRRDVIDELQRLTSRYDSLKNLNRPHDPPEDRRQDLQRIAESVGDLINRETPQDQLAPLVELTAQLLAQLYRESEAIDGWGTKVLADLTQLESRLCNEVSSQLELAATVGLERLRITSIPSLGSHESYYWKEGPIATTAFLQKYHQTSAAAQAAVLLANAYEIARNSPEGLPSPGIGPFPEPTHHWYREAIKQAPDSRWGRLARGCLNRLDLVGQSLQVSGNSLDGKPLSLDSLRGKSTVVVFFRANQGSWHLQPNKTPWDPSPKIDSWGQFATPLEFAVATRDRGCQLLGVHCHNPTVPQAEVKDLPKFATPEVFQNNDLFPVIDDSADGDSSDSVRFGITWFPRLFVLVDENGKVVRTQLSEIKDLDAFLGPPMSTQPAAAPPAETLEDQATAATDGPSKSTPPGAQTETTTYIQVLPSLGRAIDRLPEAFRSDPANRQLMEDLKYARQQDFTGTLEERVPRLSKTVGDITSRIRSKSPPDLLQPLTDLAVQLLAEIHSESGDSKWKSWFFTQLSQLEQRLAKEFPNQTELAATVRLERIKIQVIPKPGGSVDDYWVKAPAGLNAFLERYPNTIAAAQAAWLMGDACETARKSPGGLPTPEVGQFPEPTYNWYHAAIKQAPDSLWGKLARGCLNRLDLVGQTLEVSGTSLVGKPLSLESFRGKPTVVVFFRPGKSSWGTAENGGDFAAAVRARGFEVLGVLCHSPTAAPDEISRIAKPNVPPAEEPADRMPVIEDAVGVEDSYSVRFGITMPRMFVRVDEAGKVVRTALTEIKDLDEFLGLQPINPLAASALPPESTTPAQPPAFTQDSAAPPVAGPPILSTMSFRLKNVVAADYTELLQNLFAGTKLTTVPRINTIIATGDESTLQKIEALLRVLDEAKSRPAAAKATIPATADADQPAQWKKEVIAFTSERSTPCRQILPVLRSIAAQGQPIQFVDVDREPELVKQHRVEAYPTVIVLVEGLEIRRLVGAVAPQKLEEMITGRPVIADEASLRTADVTPHSRPNSTGLVPLTSPSRSQSRGLLVLESRAAELAHNVRELTKTHGSEHPELIAARQQLEQTLTEALELKLKSERQQVTTLELRLTRLKAQLDQRQAVQKQIIERRMQELLESPATQWNTGEPFSDEYASDSRSRPSIPPQATGAASSIPQPAVHDQITVDLYATDPIYQNQQLIGAVVAPLNELKNVIANIRIVPGDSGRFVFAIVRDPSQRLHREAQQTGKESPTRQAIIAALKAGGINDVRWEGATDVVPANDALPTGREVAAPVSITPPDRKPADSLETTARLPLDLAEAQADVHETEAKLAIQVKLQAKGVVAIDEVIGAMRERDLAVRKRQILLEEYAATVKDLELQLAAAKAEYEGAVTIAEQTLALFHLARVSMREVTDANLRRNHAELALRRLQNRFEVLKKVGQDLPGAAPGTEQPSADTPATPTRASPDPQPVKN